MNVSIIGGGYVGMAWAYFLLKNNNNVTIIDVDPYRIESIKKRIKADFCDIGDLKIVLENSDDCSYWDEDLVIVSVPTNFDSETMNLDCSIVENVVGRVVHHNDRCLIVIKSTLNIGQCSYICNKYHLEERLVYCPEFLREGMEQKDVCHPERIIVGCESLQTAEKVVGVYKSMLCGFDNYHIVNYFEAEMIKLFSNAYLAMRIDFFNIVDMLAMNIGADAKKVITGICADSRIGYGYNNPSFGYGGYCLPKDTMQLAVDLDERGVESNLIGSITDTNIKRIEYIANYIINITKDEDCIGIYRLNVKRESDNLRESSTLKVVNYILKERRNVIIYEPILSEKNGPFIDGIKIVYEIDDLKKESDIIIANRYDAILDDVKEKVFTRDVFEEN